MTIWPRLTSLWRNFFQRDRVEQELTEELQAYVDMLVETKIKEGLKQAEARRAAMIEMGGFEQVKEGVREVRMGQTLETIWQDLRYGARVLGKRPGFTLVAAITLALGIGANTAIFSIVNGVLLRPLPYKEADRIVVLWQTQVHKGIKEDDVSPANFLDWRERNRAFEEMAAAEPWSFDLTGDGEPESFRSWLVTQNFFQLLDAKPLHGRIFAPEEYLPGSDRVIIIGHDLWQRRFGADPGVVGRKLTLRDQPYTIVGIMPPEFRLLDEREVWAPRVEQERDRQIRGGTYLKVIARLKPGVAVELAREDMQHVMAELVEEYPVVNAGAGVSVVPLPEQLVGKVRPALLVLLGAVGFVLVIACANVANLLLVRGVQRRREFAIRAALGAARARLIRQLLTESLMLAVLGGVGGMLLARWALDATLALSPADLPRLSEISVDGRVLVFAIAVSVLTALVFGLAPAVQFSRADLQVSLKESGRTGEGSFPRHRLRNALIVSEVALALVLLVGAGLLTRSFIRLLQVDPGFSSDNAVALEVHVWRKYQQPELRAAFFKQTIDRISALPGVEAAGAVSALPFISRSSSVDLETEFTIEGRPEPEPGREPSAYITFATNDYFRAMAIPLLGGRYFGESDGGGAPAVAIISEATARRYWPGEDPIGKKINIRPIARYVAAMEREIVGVVRDVKHTGLESEPRAEIYLPHSQNPVGSMTYVVRTEGDPAAMLDSIKGQVWEVNKAMPFSSTATIDQLVSKSLGAPRFNLMLLGSFALLAALLAGVGIYGLISFSVSQRTHEIGVRRALGAGSGDIVRMILGQGLKLVVTGIAIGLVGAIILTRFLQTMLYEVSATDTLTFVIISLSLSGVGLVACLVPARRATKVDPMVALRYE